MLGDQELKRLQERIGWSFASVELLELAMTHKSWSNEHAEDVGNNERLEFLGDAVLDLAIGTLLFAHPEALPEGELTRVRAELVNERGLAALARELDLGSSLRLGRGERGSGGADKDSLLANALEAVFGALFLDAGYEVAAEAVARLFSQRLIEALRDRQGGDYKSRLQESLQGRYGATPRYRELSAEGPAHERVYTAVVEFQGRELAQGRGRTKKEAEQAAARKALSDLDA